MNKDIKDKIITFRITQIEYSKLKALSDLYCDGDVSEFIRQCALENYVPVLKKGSELDKFRLKEDGESASELPSKD